MSQTPPDSDPSVANRIESIRSSLHCFTYSLFGLIPIIGLPWWLAAMYLARKARRATRDSWNPAARYLKLAGWMMPLTLLTNAVFLMLTAIVLTVIGSGGGVCSTGHG